MDLQPVASTAAQAATGHDAADETEQADAEDMRVEVVNVDYYLSAPLPMGALAKLPASPCYLLARQVPVVRVFGATPAGQKACVHIHGLFPYFYFRAEDDPAFDDPEQLRRLLPRIAMELEKANELKQQQNQRNRTNGSGPPASGAAAPVAGDDPAQARPRRGGAAKLVAKLLIVQGTPFYGYHGRPRLFVQIFLYNPRTVGSVVQLLESGCIAERVFQPYEAHIPFLLQVFADYNIEGMNSIHLSNVMFRAPLPSSQDHLAAAAGDHEGLSVLLRSNVPSSRVNGDAQSISQIVKGRHARVPEIAPRWFDRQSSCALEVDVTAESILNRSIAHKLQISMAKSGELRNVPSLAALWEEERQRRIQNGERSTPEISLSVERKVDATPDASANVAQSAASSLLSQSFFRQKMEDATTSILEKLIKESEKHALAGGSAGSDGSLTLEDISLAGGSLPFSGSGGEVSSVRNSTITTKSAFSFSQIEHDSAVSDKETSSEQKIPSDHEDQAIIDVLISMQRTTEPEWRERVRSQLHNDDHHVLSAASDTELSDVDEPTADAPRLDEIGDILASQRPHDVDEEIEDRSDMQPWWDVVHDQAKLSSSSSLLELGSPRIDLDAVDSKTHRTPASCRTRRRIDLSDQTALSSNEDSEIIPDIENLLPPPPRPRSRAANFRKAVNEDDEEDSVPFDPLIVSLTPQPRRRRGHSLSSQLSAGESHAPPFRRRPSANRRVWMFQPIPPTIAQLLESSKPLGIELMEHKPAFYSASDDIPEKPLIFSGRKFEFSPIDMAHTAPFQTLDLRRKLHPKDADDWVSMRAQLSQNACNPDHGRVRRVRTPVRPPPTVASVLRWCESNRSTQPPSTLSQRAKKSRLIEPLTTSLDAKRLAPSSINSNLTVMSIEVHANSRGGLLPDPRQDRIEILCYAVEAQEGPTEQKTKGRGVIMCKPEDFVGNEEFGFCIDDGEITVSLAGDERELIAKLEALVHLWDPDFLAGFEVQKDSIGYLVDRASQLNVNLIQTLSRLPTTTVDTRNLGAMQAPEDEDGEESGEGVSIGTTWGVTKASGLWIHGRFVLNIWRLARSEVKLSRYSREDIVRAVLKREFPTFSSEQLTTWYNRGGAMRWRAIRHTLDKAKCNLQLLSRIQLITRTSEMARLFGMDFYSVLSRGSQYRVESVMLRLTKRNNCLLVSPSRTQVARQAAMECIPLVMEPQSSFYSDPVVVLDFQSLYPSLVIGYNLCYSTIFGRLRDGLNADLETALGVVDFTPCAEGLIEDRHNLITVPNGVLISSKSHRLGVLPVILDEILSTRIMVKNAMKAAKKRGDERLEKVLNARQLALKMLSNVTYGYTAAGFSGRMPCAQLADAIVQTGRCTLEAAVRLVEGHGSWNAKVVYGDTDSLFVLLRGRSKEAALRIGQEIADAVTAANPKPVTLKMEKVYMGCILVSKKRYVGLKYESPDQAVGVIESKGVEIVRRDSCGVVQHSMQRCLELLFATSDLSLVKQSLEDYWLRMLDDQIPLKDFVFAKEVRLGTYARGSAPPAALVSAKAMAKDPRAEPRYAERVPYVVVNGPPGARLMDLVVCPTDFLDRRRGASLSINYQYYIHKQMIPSLERLFLLMGANVRLWFTQLPRVAGKARAAAASTVRASSKKSLLPETHSIDSFYLSKHCRLCGTMGQNALCQDCESNPQRSEFVRQVLAARREQSLETLRLVCTACGGRDAMRACGNVSCGVWNRVRLIENGREQEEFSVKW